MILLILIYTLNIFSFSQIEPNGTLKVKIEGVQEIKGSIAVALYSSEKDFLKKDFRNIHYPIGNDEIVIEFKNLPAGTYGIGIFHDLNNNKELDKNFIGLPKEPYGFGNNAKGTFGPPSFEDASFVLAEGQSVFMTIKFD